MTCLTFDPSTATLNDEITVRRTDGATILANLPRNIDDFATPARPSLRERLASIFSFSAQTPLR